MLSAAAPAGLPPAAIKQGWLGPASDSTLDVFSLWAVDPDAFSTHTAARIGHTYHQHPLLQLPALAELAKALAPRWLCHYLAPGEPWPVDPLPGTALVDAALKGDMFEHLETPGARVQLRHVDTEPSYAALIDEILTLARPLWAAEQHNLFDISAHIIVATPPIRTPMRMLRENSFWLQLQGQLEADVYDACDRTLVSAEEIERLIVQDEPGCWLSSPAPQRALQQYVATSGEGLYMPCATPHRIRVPQHAPHRDESASITLAVFFHSRETRDRAHVHVFNRFIRQRLGLTPLEPGCSAWRDALKAPLGQTIVRARELWEKSPLLPGL